MSKPVEYVRQLFGNPRRKGDLAKRKIVESWNNLWQFNDSFVLFDSLRKPVASSYIVLFGQELFLVSKFLTRVGFLTSVPVLV